MRIYHSNSHRALAGGSIEIEGRWAGVQWLALGLLAALPLLARSPLGLGLLSVVAVWLFVFPARRRVIFDGRRRTLRLEHAGLFREPGALEIPGGEDEGPADGLTLDLAIDRLVHANPDLGTKSQEIPKAQADTLTAGLRANPLILASADNVP